MYSHHQVEKDFLSAQNLLQKNRNDVLSKLIDSTLLKPQTTPENIKALCEEAKKKHFRAVCVPPCYVTFAAQQLNQLETQYIDKNIANEYGDVSLCTVIGFPNGYNSTKVKCFEAEQAIADGAEEIDFVQNVSLVKAKNFTALENEYRELVKTVKDKLIKVILETSLLTDEEIYLCTLLAAQCGVHIVKTSTGFGERGASLNDIQIIKKALDEHANKTGIRCGIKASGGVRNLQDALAFLQAGATRLGTSQGKNILLGNGNNNLY